MKKYQAEFRYFKQKIEELCNLLDIERLPKRYCKDPLKNKAVLKDRETLLKKHLAADQKIASLVKDQITEFSKEGTEPGFSEDENKMDLYI